MLKIIILLFCYETSFDKIKMCDYFNFYYKTEFGVTLFKEKQWNVALLIGNK